MSIKKQYNRLLRLLNITCNTNGIFNAHSRGLVGPNKKYKKFIILGHQRSGSSLLIGSLRRHHQVVGFGELFTKKRISFNIDGYDNFSSGLIEARNSHPIEFLDQYIFSSYPEEKRAVGFKVFPNQLNKRRFKCVWDWIAQNKDLAIVFLHRQNMLATYASLLIAKQTGVFGISDESQRTDIKITINARDCIDEFSKNENYLAMARERISNHPVLEILYEDLSQDPEAVIGSVQEFLGLEKLRSALASVKKEVRPLSIVIENFQELKQQLSNTRWSTFFYNQ